MVGLDKLEIKPTQLKLVELRLGLSLAIFTQHINSVLGKLKYPTRVLTIIPILDIKTNPNDDIKLLVPTSVDLSPPDH